MHVPSICPSLPVQFYTIQDVTKADSSTWTGLLFLTFVNSNGDEVVRTIPTNGTASYKALQSMGSQSYYCERLRPGYSSCEQLPLFVPQVNKTCNIHHPPSLPPSPPSFPPHPPSPSPPLPPVPPPAIRPLGPYTASCSKIQWTSSSNTLHAVCRDKDNNTHDTMIIVTTCGPQQPAYIGIDPASGLLVCAPNPAPVGPYLTLCEDVKWSSPSSLSAYCPALGTSWYSELDVSSCGPQLPAFVGVDPQTGNLVCAQPPPAAGIVQHLQLGPLAVTLPTPPPLAP